MSDPSSPIHNTFGAEAHPDEGYPATPEMRHSSSRQPLTRTVAIIKPHALQHRFDIEHRIQEAGFEIVKERQMEFDTETDPDALFDLFGEDATNFSEGPVWVYVLERRRAVEVWKSLMGDHDPQVARQDTPTSLRALYGLSAQQNGVMGSEDEHYAEAQIAAIFMSSPPFPPAELSTDSIDSAILNGLRQSGSDEGYAPSNGSTANGRLTANGKPGFRARNLPATHLSPDIVPRMSKAAALRAGIPTEKKDSSPRAPISKERQAETFANVPGHKRAQPIAVASTAAPAIAPRMTKAAALRLGIKLEPTTKSRSQSTDDGKPKGTFEGVPGHKRRESIAVASTKAPTVAPRLNKSASLRAAKDHNQATPSSMFRSPGAPKTPGSISRGSSVNGLSASTSSRPSLSRATSQALASPSPPARKLPTAAAATASPRSVSALGSRPAAATASPRSASVLGSRPPSAAGSTTSKHHRRPSSISSPPSITPRTNKSAALRQAKKEAEQQAAAAAAAKAASAKKPVRPRMSAAPPSSFKAVAV